MVRCIVTIRNQDATIRGTVTLTQRNASAATTVEGSITGLAPGAHGIAIGVWGVPHYAAEAAGTYTGESSAGSVGDLGAVTASADGAAAVACGETSVQLYGPYSIIGRSLAVYEGASCSGAVAASGVVGVIA
jgi:Cu-Zn family superoxide dismutase